ncbi:MAG: DUF711 family protein [Candidatus Acidiferrales bacterium]
MRNIFRHRRNTATVGQNACLFEDVASLAYKWHKPLAARLLPAKGKKAGERAEFHDLCLVNATIQPVR